MQCEKADLGQTAELAQLAASGPGASGHCGHLFIEENRLMPLA